MTKEITRKIVIALAPLIASTVVAYWAVQQTESYKIAEAYVTEMREVDRLGHPIAIRLRFFGYSMEVSGSSGTAEFSFDVKGDGHNAVAHVRLKKDLGQWSVVGAKLR